MGEILDVVEGLTVGLGSLLEDPISIGIISGEDDRNPIERVSDLGDRDYGRRALCNPVACDPMLFDIPSSFETSHGIPPFDWKQALSEGPGLALHPRTATEGRPYSFTLHCTRSIARFVKRSLQRLLRLPRRLGLEPRKVQPREGAR